MLIVLAGWVVARVAGWIVGRALGRLGVDRAVERVRVGQLLRQVGFAGKPSTIAGQLVY